MLAGGMLKNILQYIVYLVLGMEQGKFYCGLGFLICAKTSALPLLFVILSIVPLMRPIVPPEQATSALSHKKVFMKLCASA